MNRIAITLTTFTASVFGLQMLAASEPSLQSIEARLKTLEARLTTIEGSLSEGYGPSHTYTSTATLEATNGSPAISAPPIPAETSNKGAVVTPSGKTYVIQDGDTLGKIAAKFSVERKDLLEVNRLSEGQPIYIGETLMIPATVTASTEPAPKKEEAPAPVADSGKLVPAKQEAIVVGETKKSAPASTTVHTVVKGDTLTAVAKKYNTTVESLKSANGLRGDTISLGQTLKIPSTKTASNTTEPATASSTSKPEQATVFEYDNPLLNKNETYGYYSVAAGDNLYALARDFFTTMSELQRVNNLGDSTIIHPGDEIIVPTSKYNAYHKTGEMAKR